MSDTIPSEQSPADGTEPRRDAFQSSLLGRAYRALGPLAGALILDATDLLTAGPIGLVIGLPIGAAVGWWLTSFHRLTTAARVGFTTLAAVYCFVPFTELIPVATLLAVGGRFLDADPLQEDPPIDEPPPDEPTSSAHDIRERLPD